MNVPRPLLAFLLVACPGCYDWSPTGGSLPGVDDDDASLGDDDDSSGDDDDAVGPCFDDPAPEDGPEDPDCRVDLEIATDPDLEILWQVDTFAVLPGYDQVMMTPIVVPLADTDGDGAISAADTRAVVFTTYANGAYNSDGVLRALDATGTPLWTVEDAGWRLQPGAGLAAADLDGDGWPEIVAVHETGRLAGFDRTGAPLWLSDTTFVGSGGAPFLADMDADGAVEIVYANQIFDASGGLLGTGGHGTGATYTAVHYASSLVADLDLDGEQEVIVGNAAYRRDGTTLWFNGEQDGAPGVGNFDDDPEGEVVVVSYGSLRIQDSDGTVLVGPIPIAGDGNGGPPTVADFDGDGRPEIGVANLSYYSMFDTDGTLLWSNPTEDDSSSITVSSAFDFDGDGAREVVYADEHDVWVWHGATGALIHQGAGHASGTLVEYPVVAQLLGTSGPPQIIVGSNNMWWEGWTGITVLADSGRSWMSTRQVWNQHAFVSTGISDDLSIPASPQMPWEAGVGLRENAITSAPGVAAPDLSLELHATCPAACVVRVRPLNTGTTSGPFDVQLLADGVPVATATSPGVAGGRRGAAIDLAVDPGLSLAGATLMVLIDAADAVDECDETNNTAPVAALECE